MAHLKNVLDGLPVATWARVASLVVLVPITAVVALAPQRTLERWFSHL